VKDIKETTADAAPHSSMFSEVYSGQILEDNEKDDGAINTEKEGDLVGDSWFSGKLKFRKHVDDLYRNSDGRKVDDYKVVDPRGQYSYGVDKK
jgi:hypothetical protein